MARWDELVQIVAENIGDPTLRTIPDGQVLDALKKSQDEICRRTLAKKGTTSISLVAGTSAYTLASGSWKIEKILTPKSWEQPLTIIEDSTAFDALAVPNDESGTPLIATMWNGTLILWPIPDTSEAIVVLTYLRPTAVPAYGTDPIVDSLWDDCIAHGATASMALRLIAQNPVMERISAIHSRLFEKKLRENEIQTQAETLGSNLMVDHWSDTLGF